MVTVKLHESDVIALGDELGVRWEETWTCFRGEQIHCGVCAACVERRGAFAEVGINDSVVYRE
jgi:7-cyano-7-deazaguanine synthase